MREDSNTTIEWAVSACNAQGNVCKGFWLQGCMEGRSIYLCKLRDNASSGQSGSGSADCCTPYTYKSSRSSCIYHKEAGINMIILLNLLSNLFQNFFCHLKI